MRKEQIVDGFKEYEVFLASLNTRIDTEAKAHAPIAAGKWSVAEIVMHLAEWDRFIREERLPSMKEGTAVGSLPEVDEFNRVAVEPVKKMKFPEVLSHAQKQRALLRKELEEMDEEDWSAAFTVGNHETNAADYFKGLLSHDAHHRRQIDAFLT